MGSLQEHHVRRNNTNDARSADLDVYCCVDLSWSSIQFVSASVHIENKVQWWGISKSDFSHYFFFLSLIPHFCRHRRLLIAAACVHRSLAAFIAVVRQKYAIRISLSFFSFYLSWGDWVMSSLNTLYIYGFLFFGMSCVVHFNVFFFFSFLFRRCRKSWLRSKNEWINAVNNAFDVFVWVRCRLRSGTKSAAEIIKFNWNEFLSVRREEKNISLK